MDELLVIVSLASVSLFGGILSALVASLRARSDKKAVEAETQRSLEDRLVDLGDLMRSSAQVLEEVQAEIQARVALAEKAKQDAQEAERVAQLNEAQRIAVARLVRAELAHEVHRSSRRTFWQGFAVNFLFFVGGVIASVVTALVLEA